MKSQIPRKVVKTLILIAFVYQLFDLTRDYLRYEYLIDVDVKREYSFVPSVTICVNPLHRMISTNYSNSYDLFNKTFGCKYWINDRNYWSSCLDLDSIVSVRFKNNTVCLTYLYSAHYLDYHAFYFTASFSRAEFIFHQYFHPSHFERSNRFKVNIMDRKKQIGAMLDVKRWAKTLLPFPYSTNCFDYSINRRNNVSPKSQNNCKLEYMRRKELNECNHNYYWSQHLFDMNNQTIDFNQTFTNCSVKVDQIFLDKVCQKDCLNIELVVSKEDYLSYYPGSYVFFKRYLENYIHLTYLAKIDLIAYLSTMGGLISMYLGLAVIDLTNICLDALVKISLIVIKTKCFSSKKKLFIQLKKLFSKFIFLYLMFHQLIEMTNDFIYNNEKTDINFRANYRLPKIVLNFRPSLNPQRLQEKYPEYYKKLRRRRRHLNSFLELEKMYLLDSLINNISELKYLTNFDEIKINCRFANEGNHAECPEPFELIRTYREYSLSITYQFFHTYFNSKITPRLITIELSGNFHVKSMLLQLSSLSMIDLFGKISILDYNINPGEINTYTINSIVSKKLSNNENKFNDHQGSFISDNLKDDLTLDCIHKEVNETFGCLPVIGVFAFIRLKRDLNHFQYTICPKTIGNNSISIIKPMAERCFDKIIHSFETTILNVFNNHRKFDKPSSTKINILFKTNFIPEYKQNYRMNFNEWVYNCGGIVGLWFGWSALSMSGLPYLLQHYFKLIKIYFNHLKQYLSKNYLLMKEILKKYLNILKHFFKDIIISCVGIVGKTLKWLTLSLLGFILFLLNYIVKFYKLIFFIN